MNPVIELLLKNDVRSSKIGKHLAGKALKNPKLLKEIIVFLKHEDKNVRTGVAETFAEIAKNNVNIVKEYADGLMEGLNLPEPQTRWECLYALDCIIQEFPEKIDLVSSILLQLNDTSSMIVRSVAARLMGTWALGNKKRQDKILPILLKQLDIRGWDNEGTQIIFSLIRIAESSGDDELITNILKIPRPYKEYKVQNVVKMIKKFEKNRSFKIKQ